MFQSRGVIKKKSLTMLLSSKHVRKCVVYPWGFVFVGIYAVRATKTETWTRSFRIATWILECSLTFPEWSKKIESVLQTGQSFKREEDILLGKTDTYALISYFWNGMIPEDKKSVVAIVDKNENYSVACLLEICDNVFIATKEF